AASIPLPRSLAARCIPILLRRKKPSDVVTRFEYRVASEEAGKITRQIKQWKEDNLEFFQKTAQNPPDNLPPYLPPPDHHSPPPRAGLRGAPASHRQPHRWAVAGEGAGRNPFPLEAVRCQHGHRATVGCALGLCLQRKS